MEDWGNNRSTYHRPVKVNIYVFASLKILRQHHQIAGISLKLLTTKSDGKPSDGQGNDLGYGKNVKDWIIRNQVLKVFFKYYKKPMDAVHRLNVDGVFILLYRDLKI